MVHSHDDDYLRKQVAGMKAELSKLDTGVKAYEADKKAAAAKGEPVDLTKHMFVSSVLRNLPHIEAVVKLQQALQQAYCMHAVEAQAAVLSEPNSLQFASGSTCLQLHGLKACFQNMTDIHEMRTALYPRRQIMAQMYATMVKSGLTPKDMLEMKADTHGEEIAAFMNSVLANSQLDQASFVLYSTPELPKCAILNT